MMPLQDLMQQYAIEEGAESKAKDECSNQRRLRVDGGMLVAFARHEGRSEIGRRRARIVPYLRSAIGMRVNGKCSRNCDQVEVKSPPRAREEPDGGSDPALSRTRSTSLPRAHRLRPLGMHEVDGRPNCPAPG